MGRELLASATVRPSGLLKRMRKHTGDVSEGNRVELEARRSILGMEVEFYRDGTRRFVNATNLNEEEMYNSEILRFAHASILINGPVGDKKLCWVDATKNPVELWLYNKHMKRASDLNTEEVFKRVKEYIL